jgi:DNA-binding XRE family transcriptional regulator
VSVQFIVQGRRRMFAVVPIDEYNRLVARAARAGDARTVAAFRRARRAGAAEVVPVEVLDRLLGGESPVRVWREHRGLTIQALALAADVSAPYVSQIESGKRQPTVVVLKRIAAALAVDLDDLT